MALPAPGAPALGAPCVVLGTKEVVFQDFYRISNCFMISTGFVLAFDLDLILDLAGSCFDFDLDLIWI